VHCSCIVTVFFILILGGIRCDIPRAMDCTYLSLQLNLGYAIAFLIFLQRCQDRLDHARFLQITRILANRTKKFIVSRAHTFIRTFIIWYKFTIKHCVYLNISEWYFAHVSALSLSHRRIGEIRCVQSLSRHRSIYSFILIFLNDTLHTFQHYLSRIEELVRFDVSRVYRGTGQYTAFERCINLAPSKSRAISGTHLHEAFAHSIFQIYESHVTSD